jgi:ribosome biogenesis SPOUT family RNA methylase Rps3
MKYIVEHLDEEVGGWCRLEYKHIHNTVGDRYVITNVSSEDKKQLPQEFVTGTCPISASRNARGE